MAVYKRGDTYYYEFMFKGKRYRESTHQGNKNVARDMESARRSALAKGEVGILDRAGGADTQRIRGAVRGGDRNGSRREARNRVVLQREIPPAARVCAIRERAAGRHRREHDRHVQADRDVGNSPATAG